MINKKLILSLLPILAIGALASCAGKPGPESDVDSVPESQPDSESNAVEKTNISIWTTLSYQTQLENMIASFEEANPNIHVENVKVSGSYDDLKSQTIQGFPTDNYPDIVLAYPDHVADYLDYNKAANMESYMNNETYGWTEDEIDDIVPSFLSEGSDYSVPGVYSLPFCKSTEAMFYNASVLVGLNLSTVDPTINNGNALTEDYLNNLTWDELFDKLCPAILEYNEGLDEKAKILNQTEDGNWAVIGYDSDDNLFITLAEQYGFAYTEIDETTGKGKALWNTPEMKALLKKFNDAKAKHYFMTKGTLGGYVNYEFVEGSCLFSVGSTGGVKYQNPESNPFNVNVARIPQANHNNIKLINQGPSLAFLKHPGSDGKTDKARLEAAWKFYKHTAETANVTAWATATGYMPTRYSSYESEAYLEYSNTEDKDMYSLELLTAKNATYCSTVLNNLFASPVFKGSSECRSQVGGLLTALLLLDPAQYDAQVDGLFETSVNQATLKM